MLLNIQAVQLARAGFLAGSLLGASFLQAQTRCPPSGGAALESGWRAYRADSLPKAIRQFELAQRLCPDNLDAGVGLGFPWDLLNVTDPSSRTLLFDRESAGPFGTAAAEDFHVGVAIYQKGAGGGL